MKGVPVRVVRSGRRHRIGNAHILVAMANAPAPTLVETEDGPQLHFLGLETIEVSSCTSSRSQTTAARAA